MESQLVLLDQAKSTLVDLGIKFGPKVFVAVLIVVCGFYAGRYVGRMFDRSFARLQLEPPLRLLLLRIVRLLVLALFLIMALDNLGVELLPLIAGLGVLGAGIALAMQGVLGNMAAGLIIIFTRPFRVGDYIAIAGVEGRVEAIEVFSTQLSHADLSMVVVPNRKIVGEILHNYGQIRQLNLGVKLAHTEDVERALAIIEDVVKAYSPALREPMPLIRVASLDAAFVTISVAPWVNVTDYPLAGGYLNRAILAKLGTSGVHYPLPALAVVGDGG